MRNGYPCVSSRQAAPEDSDAAPKSTTTSPKLTAGADVVEELTVVRALLEPRLARILKRVDALDKDIDALIAALRRDRAAFAAWARAPKSRPVAGRHPGRPQGAKDRLPRRPRRNGAWAFRDDDDSDL